MDSYIEYQRHNSVWSNYHDIRYYSFRDFQFNYNFHKAHEIIYLLDGELDLVVDGKESHMLAGDVAMIISNQIHSFSAAQNQSAELLIHVVSIDVLESFTQLLGNKVGESALLTPNNTTWEFLYQNYLLPLKKHWEEQHANGARWIYDQENYKQSWPIMEEVNSVSYLPYLYTVCNLYLSTQPLVNTSRDTNNAVGMLLNYVADHFMENISLESTASVLGYEPHYLSRCLSRFVKISFKQYVNNYRVDNAKKLLLDKSMTVTGAAYASGFQSLRNFNRVFYETVGMTPSEFRKSHGTSIKTST